MLQETHVRPTTGLQSFAEASPDYMLAPVGLGSFQRQAQKLAEYGRNGDIYVVHAAEGETVIPVEVLDANPKVRALLFNQMREMGMDPNEYVVGDELNSINPATGLPEFFFKSVFKSIGKAAKKVFKVVKKVAPIVLPLALSAFGVPFLGAAYPAMFGVGSIGAAFLGSGIGTLIGGGGLKDALKSGLMSAATAGLMKGISSAASPGGFSLDSLKGTPSTWKQLGSVVSGNAPFSSIMDPITPEVLGGEPAPPKAGWLQNVQSVPPVPPAPAVTTSNVAPGGAMGEGVRYTGPGANLITESPDVAAVASSSELPLAYQGAADNWAAAQGLPTPGGADYVPKRPDATLQYIVDNMEGQSLLSPPTLTVGDIEKAAHAQRVNIAHIDNKQIKEFLAETNPGWFKRNQLPLAAAGAAGYVFKDKLFGVDDEDPGLSEEQQAQLNAARGNELWDVADLPREPGETDKDYADRNNANKFAERQNRGYIIRDFQNPYTALVASGGLMQSGARGGFPRRELLIEGPGTERSDDIPAMLSDGEFVMNASAVRGADPTGRGNRHAGARNLYNIMRNFEMRA
jgi:hypothetical protein